jgi:hypothetical protein
MTTLGKTTRVPPMLCLGCGLTNTAATGVDNASAPDPGDVTVCIHCGHIMAFDETLHLRELTVQEQIAIAGDKRILAIQRARAMMGKH